MAKTIGLGRKPAQQTDAAPAPAPAKAKRGGKAALDAAKETLGTAE